MEISAKSLNAGLVVTGCYRGPSYKPKEKYHEIQSNQASLRR